MYIGNKEAILENVYVKIGKICQYLGTEIIQ